MDKYKYLLKNTGLFALSSIATRTISFFLLPVYTSHLSTEQYAIIDLLNVTQQLVFAIASCNIFSAVLNFGLEKAEQSKLVFSIGLRYMVISCVAVVFASPILLGVLNISEYIVYFLVIYILTFINSMLTTYIQVIGRMRLVAGVSVILSLVTIVLNIILIVFLGMKLEGYLLSTIIGLVVSDAILFFVGNISRELVYGWDKAIFKRMLSYCLPLIPNNIFWWINNSIDRYFLNAMTSLSIVGLYSVANKIPSLLSTISSIFQQAWIVSATKEYRDADAGVFYGKVYELYNSTMLLCTSIFIVFGKTFATILFANEFFSAWIIIPWLMMAFYYNALNMFIGSIFTAAKKTKDLLLSTIMGGITNLIFNFLLIPSMGGSGAAIATLISYLVIWIMRSSILYKSIQICIKYNKMVVSQLILTMQICLVLVDLHYLIYIQISLFLVLVWINSGSYIRMYKRAITILVHK